MMRGLFVGGFLFVLGGVSFFPLIEMFFLLRGFYVSAPKTTVRGAETPIHAAETYVRGART